MPAQDKPYRVYRGGRVKGRVPLTRHTSPSPAEPNGPRPATASPRKPRRPARWIALGLALLLVLLARVGNRELSLGRQRRLVGERARPGRGPAPAEDPRRPARLDARRRSSSSARTAATGRVARVRTGRTRSCSCAPTPGSGGSPTSRSRATSKSRSPRSGLDKINAANQIGGPALALRTVKDLTGLDVNHVVFVDFDRFEELIDAVGGIDVDVPRPHPLQPVRLPVQDGGTVLPTGRAGDSRAAFSTWTVAARSSTHASGRTCSTQPKPTSTAHGASSRSSGRPLDKVTSRRDRAAAALRRRRSRRAARHRPRRLGADAARLGLLPRGHRPCAPLPPRRGPGDGRR